MPYLIPLLFIACSSSTDPLAEYDGEYREIMVRMSAAERDNARNVRNREALQRRTAAEKARVAFFHSARLQQAISVARTAEPGSIERVKGDAYWLDSLRYSSWTEKDKAEETRLLGKLEEAASQEATWTSPDGELTLELNQGWTDVSERADAFETPLREQLYAEYINNRMQVVGENLQELVRLRNQVAERAGFDNYWELSLATSGLSPQEVDTLIEDLRPIIAPTNTAITATIQQAADAAGVPVTQANLPMLRRKAGLEALSDEVSGYFDADLAEERIVTAFQNMGLPANGWQIYTEPRRYARPGAYGFPIRPPENVAIVISQDRRWSTWQYEALAHEGAHAVWWQMLSPEMAASPPLWAPPAPWIEGFAFFFERMIFEPDFTARYIPELPDALREPLQSKRALTAAEQLTSGIVDTLTERRLYENPDDLAGLTTYSAQIRADLTGLPLPPADERGLQYAPSLLSSLSWNYPGYAQNFLFAHTIECQLYEAVLAQIGDPIANDKLGPLIQSKLVRADPAIPLPTHLQALLPNTTATDALKAYLDTAKIPPPSPADSPEGSSGG